MFCSCSPQAPRSPDEYREHTAKIILQRLEEMLDREATHAEIVAARLAGELCETISLMGSPCILSKDHTLEHRTEYGLSFSRDDEVRFVREYTARYTKD